MATMLENYQSQKSSFDNRLQTAAHSATQILEHQELMYRIGVLETCQMFVKTAPNSTEINKLAPHYLVMDAYIQHLAFERQYNQSSCEEAKKQRDTAYDSLKLVIESYRKHFGSFTPGNDAGCYRKTIANVIQTVLPVWVQYRQTYIEIKKEAF